MTSNRFYHEASHPKAPYLVGADTEAMVSAKCSLSDEDFDPALKRKWVSTNLQALDSRRLT